jgi:hypothetical protein
MPRRRQGSHDLYYRGGGAGVRTGRLISLSRNCIAISAHGRMGSSSAHLTSIKMSRNSSLNCAPFGGGGGGGGGPRRGGGGGGGPSARSSRPGGGGGGETSGRPGSARGPGGGGGGGGGPPTPGLPGAEGGAGCASAPVVNNVSAHTPDISNPFIVSVLRRMPLISLPGFGIKSTAGKHGGCFATGVPASNTLMNSDYFSGAGFRCRLSGRPASP